MGRRKIITSDEPLKPIRPAITPEGRENQMVSLAVDLAERQLREGTASSQVIVHYLKLGTTNALLEKQKLEKEVELLRAKTEALESAKKSEELFQKAIEAFRSYSPSEDTGDEDVY